MKVKEIGKSLLGSYELDVYNVHNLRDFPATRTLKRRKHYLFAIKFEQNWLGRMNGWMDYHDHGGLCYLAASSSSSYIKCEKKRNYVKPN